MLALSMPLLRAAEKEDKVQTNIKSPSPDGQFAFLEKVPVGFEREGTVDLIERKSGTVLLRVEEEIRVGWSALWAADSSRVVVTSRVGHAVQGIDVYLRKGNAFRQVKLPEPELVAKIPEKMKRGREFPYVAASNYTTVEKWNRDGSLPMEIETTIDGAGTIITATRSVVLGFDRAGKATVLKSSIAFKTEKQ